tara:strand:+ start:342 stop:479 length:138 start_codon:yes stop_codon:yes gene_type:complete
MAVKLHGHEYRGNAWASETALLIIVLLLGIISELQALALERYKVA